jgi:hypothetical protein
MFRFQHFQDIVEEQNKKIRSLEVSSVYSVIQVSVISFKLFPTHENTNLTFISNYTVI